MVSIIKEIPDHAIVALRQRAAEVRLTNSDCRVALREAQCNVEGAFKWLLENKIIERLIKETTSANPPQSV